MTKPPLIFFIHVPKASGTTVNQLLKKYEPNGAAHQQHIFKDESALSDAVNTYAWMSGHVDFATAKSRISTLTDRPIRFFACMREPRKQVCSSYNWLMEIYHKGEEFFEAHPQRAKDISQALRASPNDIEAVASNLEAYPDAFMNFQSRFILGNDFSWGDDTGRRLREYEAVTESSNPADLVSQMLQCPVDEIDHRANESRYHFDKSVFSSERITEILARRNSRDDALFRLISKR